MLYLLSFKNVCIPGQYDGKSKPLPEYHVKISGFDEKVSKHRQLYRVTHGNLWSYHTGAGDDLAAKAKEDHYTRK